jgi:hypothetical protein
MEDLGEGGQFDVVGRPLLQDIEEIGNSFPSAFRRITEAPLQVGCLSRSFRSSI